MKYCLFESGDVVGPLTAEEISLRSGFGPHTFVCPEEHSEDEAYWKEACAYADFGFEPEVPLTEASSADESLSNEKSAPNPPLSVESKTDMPPAVLETFPEPSQKEEPSSLSAARPISAILLEAAEEKSLEETTAAAEKETFASPDQAVSAPAPEDTKTEEPVVDFQTVSGAKPSPIEEYFNTIRSGDLGNILGIPDAKENSDMSLSRAMRSQFEKTEPPAGPVSEEELKDPFDAFSSVPDAPSQTFLESAEPAAFPSQPAKEPENVSLEPSSEDVLPTGATAAAQDAGMTLEPLPPQKDEKTAAGTDVSVSSGPDDASAKEEARLPSVNQNFPSSGNFPAYSAPKEPKTPDAVTTILNGKLDVKKEESDLVEPIKAVEPLEREQTAASSSADSSAPVFTPKEQKHGKGKQLFFIFGVLILLAGVLLRLSASQLASNPNVSPRPAEESAVPVPPAAETARPEPVVPQVPAVQTPSEPTDPLELSKQVAQRHELGKGRGTVEEYLNKRYAAELAAGYSSAWSSEPLHRNVYVVKYRLAKARKEPIVYIFQTDVSKKKLTGALNNITLDLVGKIRD